MTLLAHPSSSPLLIDSASSVRNARGRVEPRLWTPPLRELTPETSYGFDVITFARDALRHPLDPWQEWAVIHGGELLPDGRPRFRIVLLLVARQNGKTELPVVLSAYWQFVEGVPLVLGTSTKLDYAKESWQKAVKLIRAATHRSRRDAEADSLRRLLPAGRWIREANGEQESWTINPDTDEVETRYKIAASNAEGGRSLTIKRLVLDELRQHHDYSAWDAAEPATSAVYDAQIWALSNAGDANSVVLNDLRASALEFIRTGVGDERLGLIEYSMPEGSDPCDIEALAQANPNLGVPPHGRIDPEALLAKARRAVAKGGDALAGFITEYGCLNVPKLSPAIDPDGYRGCLEVGTLDDARSRVALCFDVAPDERHATLAAAAIMSDGRARGEIIAAWDSVAQLRRVLPELMVRVRPQALGWLPNGPSAVLAADMAERVGWPPPGVKVEAIRGELAAVCMGFAEQVKAGQFAHSGDPLLDAQIAAAERLMREGGTWVFSRKGGGHCDAVYAMAGAVHLARTLPAPVGRPRILTVPT